MLFFSTLEERAKRLYATKGIHVLDLDDSFLPDPEKQKSVDSSVN